VSLFDNMPQAGRAKSEQTGFAFPASLSERYRPRRLADFVGLDKPKKVLSRFADAPFPNAAFLFVGPSGIGKTSMGLAFCEAIRAELHHVPSQQANVETIENVIRQCHYVPSSGHSYHVILVDESDRMSKAAQLHLLSKLDATAFPPSTIFIFTANTTDGLEDRFISRCMQLQFSSHGLAEPTAELLERIWRAEAGETAERPNFLKMVRESGGNNIRDAVNSLQVELLSAA
jgi:replication-associated recombination protein RarA